MGEVHKYLNTSNTHSALSYNGPAVPGITWEPKCSAGLPPSSPTCPPADGSEAAWISALLLSPSLGTLHNPCVFLCCFSQLSRISSHSSWGCFHSLRLVEAHNTCQQQLCPFQDRPKDMRKESWARASCGHLLPHQARFLTQGEMQNNYTERPNELLPFQTTAPYSGNLSMRNGSLFLTYCLFFFFFGCPCEAPMSQG